MRQSNRNTMRAFGKLLQSAADAMDRHWRVRRDIQMHGLDTTIEKIDGAVDSLRDAAAAIEQIKDASRRAKNEMDFLKERLAHQQGAYDEVMAASRDLKDLLEKDKKRLQDALGIKPWRERWWGFVMGVLASFATLWLLDGWAWVKSFAQARNWL